MPSPRGLFTASLLASSVALACLWDSDTFEEEALRKKDVAELTRGVVRKHSTFFYEQKVQYTQPLIDRGDAPAERYDDLAVAFDHLGRFDEALAVMEQKERRFPGQYTTLANRGTFHAHRKEWDQALELLRAAIALNPDAHFGRERYQVQAIEYLRALEKDPTLAERRDLLGVDLTDEHQLFFGDHGRYRAGQPTGLDRAKLRRDVFVGLGGIIRFGHGESSPHLWFSLGVAFALDGDRHLALRCFARAHELGHPRGRALAEAMAMAIRKLEGKVDFSALSREFAAGQATVKQRQDEEDTKLRAGKQRAVFGY
ncbi:MAG: tetratricopeptide repeat protein [Myxococcota bacterium]